MNSVPFTIDVEYLIEMILGNHFQGREFADAGVGENDVDASFRPDGLVEPIQIFQIGDVSANAGDVAAYDLHGLVQFLLAPAGNEDIGAFFNEELRRRQADSRGPAGDDRELSR